MAWACLSRKVLYNTPCSCNLSIHSFLTPYQHVNAPTILSSSSSSSSSSFSSPLSSSPSLIIIISIITGIVEQHNAGKIWAESEGEGTGCTFFVKLPVIFHTPEQIDYHQSTMVGSRSSRQPQQPTSTSTGIPPSSIRQGGGASNDKNAIEYAAAGGGIVDAGNGKGIPTELGMDTAGGGSRLHTPKSNHLNDNISNMNSTRSNEPTSSRLLIDVGSRTPDGISSSEQASTTPSITPSIKEINRPTGVDDNQPLLPGIQPGNTLGALNILVVDDSPANRKMVVRMLKLDGHRCVEAIDGLAAVGAVSRSMIRRLKGEEIPEFDVILMDKNMPKMSGPDAAREMRRLGLVKPIIGITGSDDNVEFIQAGMRHPYCNARSNTPHYLTHPFAHNFLYRIHPTLSHPLRPLIPPPLPPSYLLTSITLHSPPHPPPLLCHASR